MTPVADTRGEARNAFRAQNYARALELYSEALASCPDDASLLNNRALVHLKLSDPGAALEDAVAAEDALRREVTASSCGENDFDDAWVTKLAKALFIQGNSHLDEGNSLTACEAFCKALRLAPGDRAVLLGLQRSVASLDVATVAQRVARAVALGEAPSPLAKREGRLLRFVFPEEARLGTARLAQHLQDALVGRERIGRAMLLAIWTREALRREPERHVLYAARALAYLRAGSAGQALEDARQAVAHGGGAATGAPAQAAQGPVGALAHALYARSLLASHAETEVLTEPGKGRDFAAPARSVSALHFRLAVDSALTVAAQHAIPHVRASPSCRQTTESERHDVAAKERQNGGAGGPSSQAATSNNAPASSSNEPSSPSLLGSAGPCFVQAAWADDADWYREELEALSDRLPPAHVKALAAGGAAGLFARLAEEAAAQLPEFLQPRPKYYHYFNWMRERITQALGAPPEEEVMDKLLTMDAGELDLIVQHPAAVKKRAQEYTQLLLGCGDSPEARAQGAQHLATFQPRPLSYEEFKRLRDGLQVATAEILPGGTPGSSGGPQLLQASS